MIRRQPISRKVKAKDVIGLAKRLNKYRLAPRKSKPRARRKGKRASLARQCDLLWGQIVRRQGYCENCNKRDYLQAAHGFSRRYRGTRWLPINGFCLCRSCHKRWTHDHLGWTDWLIDRWGLDVYEELKRKARAIAKPDHAAILASLKKELGL